MKPQEYVWKFLQENASKFPNGYPQQLKVALEDFAEWYAAQQGEQPTRGTCACGNAISPDNQCEGCAGLL
jgi:hypothetical protein